MTEIQPLWTPSSKQVADSNMSEFARSVEATEGVKFSDYNSLHQWSCQSGAKFWDKLWDYVGVIGEKGERIVVDEDKMPGAQYFPDARLNYAENLLKHKGDSEAIVFRAEDKFESRLTHNELHAMVSRFQQAFIADGLQKGDRVAAMMPNMPETIAAMLAVTSLGAIWSSCSPDFGVKGVLDRFGQINPKIFITCDGYWYGGKRIEIADKLNEIVPELGCITTVIVPLLGDAQTVAADLKHTTTMEDYLYSHKGGEVSFEPLVFSILQHADG